MRIKRQRRKLRGKYSGNCLSCAAKWSKCWYIASVDNQAEWEARLNKPVTPCTDEVCFQCWDAKIRTSPKRKMNFKSELPAIAELSADTSSSTGYPLRPLKRADRHKRRALNEGGAYAYGLHSAEELYDSKGSDGSDEDYLAEEEGGGDESNPSTSYYTDGGIIMDEEDAVLLLSTAFHSIPRQIAEVTEMRITINAGCGRGGDVMPSGDLMNRSACYEAPSPSSPHPPLVFIPQHSVLSSPSTAALPPVFQSPSPSSSISIISALIAQPVVS